VKVSRNRTPSAYAARLGLDPGAFSGHSLRTGFLTSATAHGASQFKMMDVSRQRSVDTQRGYVCDADAFREQRLRRVRWGAPAKSNEASTYKLRAGSAAREDEQISRVVPRAAPAATRRNSASASSGGLRFVRFAW
jgi:hypothetical protein